MKTIRKVLKIQKAVKVSDKTKAKKISAFVGTVRKYARGVIIVDALKARKIATGKEVVLASLKVDGKLFSDLASSRPLLGTTSRRMILVAGWKTEVIKASATNKKLASIVKFTKV